MTHVSQARSKRLTQEDIISNAFEDEFALESLKSDKLRVTILIGAVVSAAAILLIQFAFSFDQFQRSFHGNFYGFLISFLVFLSVILLSLLIERRVIIRLIKERGRGFGFSVPECLR